MKTKKCLHSHWRKSLAMLTCIYLSTMIPTSHATFQILQQDRFYSWIPDYNYRTEDPDAWTESRDPNQLLWNFGTSPLAGDSIWTVIPHGIAWVNTGSEFEYTPSFPDWGWPNIPYPMNLTDDYLVDTPWSHNTDGQYRFMTNYWNLDTVIADTSDTASIDEWIPLELQVLQVEIEDGFNTQPGYAPGTFRVLISPDSYWATGRPRTGPGSGQHNACAADILETDVPCHWAPTPNNLSASTHAPAAYPAVYSGCHYEQCTESGTILDPRADTVETSIDNIPGAPYPIRVDTLTSIGSHWLTIPVNAKKTYNPASASDLADDAIYNIAYDIWFDRNTPRSPKGYKAPGTDNTVPRPPFATEPADEPGTTFTAHLPEDPQLLRQADGLEIMIWVGNNGYVSGPPGTPGDVDNSNPESVIRPAGNRVATRIEIPGVSGLWDVWATDGNPYAPDNDPASAGRPLKNEFASWYVLSYVRVSEDEDIDLTGGWMNFQFDSKWFVNHAATVPCAWVWEYGSNYMLQKTGDVAEYCLNNQWWLTSIQAGFEIWANGEFLQSSVFEALPTTEVTLMQAGRHTDVSAPPVKPVVYWGEPFRVTASCAKPNPMDSGTYELILETGTSPVPITPLERDEVGVFYGNMPVMQDFNLHGDANIQVELSCADPNADDVSITIPFYIDPAGRVRSTKGHPIPGAKVQLYYKANMSDAWILVPDGDATYMSEANRRNPSYTGQYGEFRWDVSPGFYKVRAGYGHCHKPGDASIPYVESATYNIPPEVTGIDLVLECPEAPVNAGPIDEELFCDWYADGMYPICEFDTGWWGWENNTNCISQSACDSTGNDTVDSSGTPVDDDWLDENGTVKGDGEYADNDPELTRPDGVFPGDASSSSSSSTSSSGGSSSSSSGGSSSSSSSGGSSSSSSSGGSSGYYPITVHARGNSGKEKIKLTVGGVVVGHWQLGTGFQNYSVITNLSGGINVEYYNDVPYQGDVVLDFLLINGVKHEAENQTQNTATWGNGSCGGGGFSEWMHCNGYIGFPAFK